MEIAALPHARAKTRSLPDFQGLRLASRVSVGRAAQAMASLPKALSQAEKAAKAKAERNLADRSRRVAKGQALADWLRIPAGPPAGRARASDGRADGDAEAERSIAARDEKDALAAVTAYRAAGLGDRKRRAPGAFALAGLKKARADDPSAPAADAETAKSAVDDIQDRLKGAEMAAEAQLWRSRGVAAAMVAEKAPSEAHASILLRLQGAARACETAAAELGMSSALWANFDSFKFWGPGSRDKDAAEALMLRTQAATNNLATWAKAGSAVTAPAEIKTKLSAKSAGARSE